MATIQDVARQARVSIATVSRVLNGGAPVSQVTRGRVLQVVADLGFQPNALARALHQKRTRSVGLLVPDISNPYYPELARGVEDAACDHGYSVVICNTYARPDKLREYVRVLGEKRVDGLILGGGAGREADDAPPVDPEAWRAVVGIGYRGLGFPTVGIDNRRAAHEAAAHLIGLGHRRIGFIGGPLERLTVQERLLGFEQCLAEHGLERDPALVRGGDFRPSGGYAVTRECLDLPEPPTAVLAANDRMAIGAIAAVTDAGLRVPGDVAVVGFDDTPVSAYIRPGLTTVSIPAYELGATAMRQVLRLLDEGGAVDQSTLLPARLVIRESSGGVRRPVRAPRQGSGSQPAA